MTTIIQNLVDLFNGVGSKTGSLLSSFITVNYHIGDHLFSAVKYFYLTCICIISTVFTALRIALEDLVIFLGETLDTLFTVFDGISQVVDAVLGRLASFGVWVQSLVLNTLLSVKNGILMVHSFVQYCVHSVVLFFNLLGSSFILLISLLPRTIYVIYTAAKSFSLNAVNICKDFLVKFVETLSTAPPEVYLGMLVGSVSLVFFTRLIIRTIQTNNITVESVATSFLHLLCRVYVLLIRTFARTIGLIFTVIEVTVSNLRVPMLSHAGDSDDEDEDRENLVGEINESDDEDRARQQQKRKNYDLLLQRRLKKGERRGSEDSVEDMLMREVEREREDKLCVICVDKEKCIMILPCRHLCICEGCQAPLRTHRNICPICRKEVKQMIKAYL